MKRNSSQGIPCAQEGEDSCSQQTAHWDLSAAAGGPMTKKG